MLLQTAHSAHFVSFKGENTLEPWHKYEGWQNSYAICYIKVLFHFYYYWGKKHHSSD